jgi:hypothetical protein
MVQRISDREGEQPGTARKRFDGQLDVRAWTTPGTTPATRQPPRDPKAPWWWDGAEDATQPFVAMARAKGMIE